MEISPYYAKKIKCINCEHDFSTTKIRSRFIRVISHDADFKPVYHVNEVNPVFYNVSVCPLCGFAFTEDFSLYFAPQTKEEISRIITSKWIERSFGGMRSSDKAIETYKLAYLSALLKKEKSISIAGLTLRIAWIYRDIAQFANEKRFLSTARNYYLKSYSEGDYVGTQMSEARVLYMIAELASRIGDHEEAIRNFSRVMEQQDRTTDLQVIKLAKERWQEIKWGKEEGALLQPPR